MKTLYESILNIDTDKTTSATEENLRIMNDICDIFKKYFDERTEGFTKISSHNSRGFFNTVGSDKMKYSSVDLNGGKEKMSIKGDIVSIKKLANNFTKTMSKYLDDYVGKNVSPSNICYRFYGDKLKKIGMNNGFGVEFDLPVSGIHYVTPKIILPSIILAKLTEG